MENIIAKRIWEKKAANLFEKQSDKSQKNVGNIYGESNVKLRACIFIFIYV